MRRCVIAGAVAVLILAFAVAAAASTSLKSPVYASHSHTGRWASYVAPATTCPGASSRGLSATTQEGAMLCLINYARQRRGLPSLKTSPQLMRAAAIKAKAILRCQEFLHTACGTPVKQQFYTVGYLIPHETEYGIGENIAWGTSYLGIPQDIMLAWLNSTCHRENIFTPGWKEQGVALRVGDLKGNHGAAVWASDFGVRGAIPGNDPEGHCE